MQIEVSTTIPLELQGVTLAEVDATVTVDIQDDGAGDYSWCVCRVDALNIAGTGHLRWDHKDIANDDFMSKLGECLWRAANNCDHIEEIVKEYWINRG